jgi:hypothetical protein
MVMVHPVVVLHLSDELQKLRALPDGGAVIVSRPLINDRLVSIGVRNVIMRSGVHSLQFNHQKPFNLGHRVAGRLGCSREMHTGKNRKQTGRQEFQVGFDSIFSRTRSGENRPG